MRCVYCMPYNNTEWFEDDNILSYEEIVKLTNIFVGLGVKKIRVTGGEPTIRPKIENLISALSEINGIKSISMTTNGLLLSDDKAKQLKEVGLESVNISLDTFRADRFKSICGIDGVDKVLASIKAAYDAGLKLKINTVTIRGWNDDAIFLFVHLNVTHFLFISSMVIVALVASLPESSFKNTIATITFGVVLSSLIIQYIGLTRYVEKVFPEEGNGTVHADDSAVKV
jgi:molybdenum cofactor biosynthesis enzyme MoaA